MKLTNKLIFTTFSCPELKLELGAGQVVYVDKTEFAVREVEHPEVFHLMPRSIHYLMTISLLPRPKEAFWAAGVHQGLPIPRPT